MKNWIKKHTFLFNLLVNIQEWGICHLTYISPILVSKIRYRQAFRKKLNLKNPQEFNEKLMWLKLYTYHKNPLVIQCADKVCVREYIKSKGCEGILIDCIGVYNNAYNIPWENLPRQFVLKCNHGSAYNIICTDKNAININSATAQLTNWLKQDYSLSYAETQYHYIKPRIICEKYLCPISGVSPDDYKVYCFNGKVACIMVCKEDEFNHHKYYLFDTNWNFLKWNINSSEENAKKIKCPACLQQLIIYAEKLSENFPFVRVDFYILDNTIYFGEMTFTPHGCTDKNYSDLGNLELSKRLNIHNKMFRL